MASFLGGDALSNHSQQQQHQNQHQHFLPRGRWNIFGSEGDSARPPPVFGSTWNGNIKKEVVGRGVEGERTSKWSVFATNDDRNNNNFMSVNQEHYQKQQQHQQQSENQYHQPMPSARPLFNRSISQKMFSFSNESSSPKKSPWAENDNAARTVGNGRRIYQSATKGFHSAFRFSSPSRKRQDQLSPVKTWTDHGVTYGYDEEGNKILMPPPPPGFGSPVPGSSSSIITSAMMKELEDSLVALVDDEPQKKTAKMAPASPMQTSQAKTTSMNIPSFVNSDPVKVAKDLDTIFFSLQNKAVAAGGNLAENGSRFANWNSLMESVKKDMKDQYALCIGNLINTEEMTVLLGAMNFAYYGPHQVTHELSAVLPKNSLYFWTQVSYGFLEAMISVSPEFFYSIPWKEYASNPEFSTDVYHKLASLAAQMRMNRESPSKRESPDSSTDGDSGTPTKRFKSPKACLSPPARTRVYDPINNEYVFECVFCKGNDQPEAAYKSHPIRVGDKVVCPLLRQYKCRLCGATEDNAHTIKYCPENITGYFATHHNGGGCRGSPHGAMLSNNSRTEDDDTRLVVEKCSRVFKSQQNSGLSGHIREHGFGRRSKPSAVRKLNFDIPSDMTSWTNYSK